MRITDSILPCFTSHHSYPKSNLTLEVKGKSKIGGMASIVDLCSENNIKQCILVESTLGGVLEAFKNLNKAGIELFLGYKVVVCADENDKSDASLKTESKVILFAKDMNGYSDLVKIANRAKTTGFYYQGRTSWKQIREFWTDNLMIGLPFFSSFIAHNTLTLNPIVPDLPANPIIFQEINSGLPFAHLIGDALEQYAESNPNCLVENVKSIYYKNYVDFEKYLVSNAKHRRTTFAKPNLNHMASDKFCFEDWKNVSKN